MIDEHLKPGGRKNQDIVSLMLDIIDKPGSEDYFKFNMDNVKAILMVKSHVNPCFLFNK